MAKHLKTLDNLGRRCVSVQLAARLLAGAVPAVAFADAEPAQETVTVQAESDPLPEPSAPDDAAALDTARGQHRR